MNYGELILVNHPAEVVAPIFPKASSAGIAFSSDLVAIAFIEGGLQTVKLFAHSDGSAFARCPYWQQWRKHVLLFEDGWNFSRILLDVSKAASRVGFDPGEVKITETYGTKFMPVAKAIWATSMLAWMEKDDYLREVLNIADRNPENDAAMLKYYWDGLRLEDGHRTFKRPADRIEPILAIVNALAAESMANEESMKAIDIARSESKARDRKAAEEREALRVEKREARRTLLKQYSDEHGGKVRVRNLRTGYIMSLPYEGAFSLIELGGGEFAP
jgi:hypothetical protein